MSTNVTEHTRHDAACCPEIPELRRLQYFYGQMLGAADFQDEQRYFREKLKLLNRCLHGYGVICGLKVTPETQEKPCEPEVDREREKLEKEIERREVEVTRLKARLEEAATEEEKKEIEEEIAAREQEIERLRRKLEELCPPDKEDKPSMKVVVGCGVALDCLGNEIVVRHPRVIDPVAALSPADLRKFESQGRSGSGASLYLRICFCETPVEPVRPVYTDKCSSTNGCRYAKIQDSYRLEVTLEAPEKEKRCDPCCCACDDACLLLARIDNVRPGEPIAPADIHNEARRRFGLHEWVNVSGVSWVHGGGYSDSQAGSVLGRNGQSNGLEFRFSGEVLTKSLRPGVVDVWVVEGGKGRSGDIYNVPVEFVNLPATKTTDRLYVRQTSDDKFHEGDRLLIRLRADFVLDECCRPVDGNHLGGRVPLLEEYEGYEHPEDTDEDCLEPPDYPGPWTSGNGHGGGTFESWIWIVGGNQKGELI